MSGALLTVNVEEGNYVREGQTLAQIDARELEAQVKSATASLELAESTAKRSDELWRQRIVTALEYERDRAALASAQASLEQLKTRLGYATIRAPISGVVTEKRLEAGDIVSPQTRLFSVAETSTLVSRVMVSELDVPLIKQGAAVDVSVDALGGARVQGRIRRVFPAADTVTRLVPVEVALTGSALNQLKPGYTIRSTFRLGSRDDALLIPTRAVMGPAGARTVVIVRQGKSERRIVRVGSGHRRHDRGARGTRGGRHRHRRRARRCCATARRFASCRRCRRTSRPSPPNVDTPAAAVTPVARTRARKSE